MIKTGKLFLTALLSVFVTHNAKLQATLTLAVYSVDNKPLKQIAIECECILRATLEVKSRDQYRSWPDITLEDKDQQFEILKRTQSQGVTIYNGAQKNLFSVTYHVKARKTGIAQLKACTKNEQSNIYILPVTESVDKTRVCALPSCTILIDKSDLVVGETRAFTVCLYLKKPYNAELKAMHAFPDALKLTQLEGPYYSLGRKDTTTISILEWQGTVTACKEGNYCIPKLLIQYYNNQQLFSFFSYAQPKELSLDPVQLTVRAIPQGLAGTPVQFVGKLLSFNSTLENSQLVQGQATTFTLTLEAIDAPKELAAPPLCLPQELSCYAPHCTRQQLKEGHTRITWHYILQARMPGSIYLPAQEFNWFDTQERVSKQVFTNAYTLTVTPAAVSHKTYDTIHDQDNVHDIKQAIESHTAISVAAQQETGQENLEHTIAAVLQVKRIHPALAWEKFYLLLAFPFGLWLFSATMFFVIDGRARRWYSYYTAYYRAYKSLRKAQEQQEVWLIYGIFRRYISDRLVFDLDLPAVTYEYLCSCMRIYYISSEHAHVHAYEHEKWCAFLQEIMSVSAYAPRNNTSEQDINSLFAAAQKWLTRVRAHI